MERSKFNFAAVFSLMVLLGYSYITFLGLVYWKEGEIVLPVILCISFLLLVIICLFVMCKSKATRWKRIGTIGQSVFGVIILSAFIVSAMPFTNFMDVLSHKDELSQEIDNVLESAKKLDNSYLSYVDVRIEDYKETLRLVSRGKAIEPTVYQELMGNAAGSNDSIKIEKLAGSLKRKLVTDSINDVIRMRQDWIAKAEGMSVWNIKFPTNISQINEEVSNWSNNYSEISTVRYAGESAETFEYEEFSSDLEELTDSYTKLHTPSLVAVLISLLCFFIMLLPYWLTEQDVAGRRSKGNSVYE